MDTLPFDIIKIISAYCGKTFQKKLHFMACSKYLNSFTELIISDTATIVTYTTQLPKFRYYNKASTLQFKENIYIRHVVNKFNKIMWPPNMTHLILRTDEPLFYNLLLNVKIPENIINLTIKSKPLASYHSIHIESSELLASNVMSVNYEIRLAHHEMIDLYITNTNTIQNIREINFIVKLHKCDNLKKLILNGVDIYGNISNKTFILINFKKDTVHDKLI